MFSSSTVDPAELVSICLHSTSNLVGILLNIALLLAIYHRTPHDVKKYSLLLSTFAMADLVACCSALFVQQRIIAFDEKILFVSSGPCRFIGSEACLIGHSITMHLYNFTLWSVALSFGYRYYVLGRTPPETRNLVVILAVTYSIALVTCVLMIMSGSDPAAIGQVLATKFPDYPLEKATVSGYLDVMEPKMIYVIVSIVLPVFPIYTFIILMRWKIIKKISSPGMSKRTQTLHSIFLKVLTLQACLPCLSSFAIISYLIGQLGLGYFPVLEYSIFIVMGLVPILSPAISIYHIRPYREWIAIKMRLTSTPRVSPTSPWRMSSRT